MIGAIIGDMAGSIYEFHNCKDISKIKLLESHNCIFTDDSVLTLATARCLVNYGGEESIEQLGTYFADSYRKYWKLYPLKRSLPIVKNILEKQNADSFYGAGFVKWAKRKDGKNGHSGANGGMMRISPVGMYYDNLERVELVAETATKCSHDNTDAIRGAVTTAGIVFLARTNKDKSVIESYVRARGYETYHGLSDLKKVQRCTHVNTDLNKALADIKKKAAIDRIAIDIVGGNSMKSKDTLEAAVYAFLNTTNYRDCITLAIATGGDSDTIACIAGAFAEAYYGEIPDDLLDKAYKILKTHHCRSEDIEMIRTF